MRTERRFHFASETIGEDDAWVLVRDLLRRLRATPGPTSGPLGLAIEGTRVVPVPVPEATLVVDLDDGPAERRWQTTLQTSPAASTVLDLCVPLCLGKRASDLVLAHLGQSLDGRVATPLGVSRLITGIEDVRHTHRLRALFDAVVVGATTALVDDPRLTTRLVPGDHPARVVLDPRARLPHDLRLFTDGKARSIVVTGHDFAHRHAAIRSRVDIVALALVDGQLPVPDVLGALRGMGLRRIFVEGGGVTVSRFLEARVLDRLHIAVAPKIIGSGAPAIELGMPPVAGAATPICRRYVLGSDVLFDCDLAEARPHALETT